MKIGVFDSGIGGRAVASQLQQDYPNAEVLYVDDHRNVPYGSRSYDEIISLTDRAIQPLLAAAVDIIVIACNTATAAAAETLRKTHPETPFVGLEPMVKPAAAITKTGIIAVCATPFTLNSRRYGELKEKYASGVSVIEPDCAEWAYMIEHSITDEQKIASVIKEVCDDGADVIVLACTHYHWIKEEILRAATGRAVVIDPTEAISRRVASILTV